MRKNVFFICLSVIILIYLQKDISLQFRYQGFTSKILLTKNPNYYETYH